MASAISLEYLQSIEAQAGGLATLDTAGRVPVAQLPDTAIDTYKRQFADPAALLLAFPAGTLGDYAYLTSSSSYWYWNAVLATPAWVNQQITAAAYSALSAAERTAVPYVIVA